MTDVSSSPRAESLLNELAAARADAVAWDFDLPSEGAYAIACSLLHRLSRTSIALDRIGVAVGEDGSVEIDISPGSVTFVAMINPSGTRLSLAAIDYPNHRVAEAPAERSELEIVERIERAAAA